MLQALLAAENEAAGGEDEEGDEDDDFPGQCPACHVRADRVAR